MHDVALPKRFRIKRKLGEGGMGVVYEALDDERGAHVALKTVRNITAEALTRFKREFRALADIHHPNLVTLGELFCENEQWFFTMELVDGGDFLEYVRPRETRWGTVTPLTPAPASVSSERAIALAPTQLFIREANVEGGFDEERLRSSLGQLAGGLEALHAAGMVHRDIKPSNIRLTDAGRLVLLDFGLVGDVTQTPLSTETRMVGTPAYMAPEQATSSAVGPAADWYAVGVLLYEALTGSLPFEGAPLQVMMKKQQHEPALPSTLAAGVPRDLEALCNALLRFDPKSRPTGAQVMRALGSVNVDTQRSHPSQTLAAPFVGRAVDLAALRDAFVASRSEQQAVSVLVAGESGVGKSCLVRHFVETLGVEAPDLVVLAGRCYEREAVPYKAFDGVVDALTRFLMRDAVAERFLPTRPAPLAQVFPVLRRVEAFARAAREPMQALDPLELRSRAFAALRDVFTRLALARPLVVVIDDIQWADADSFTLIRELLRPPETPSLLLVATVRGASPAASDSVLETAAIHRDFARSLPGNVRTVTLSRLSAEDACDLADRLLARDGASPQSPALHRRAGESNAAAIAREAGGHPFFIDALVRHGALTGDATVGRLEDALWSRVASLEPPARQLVELVAVAGAPIAQEVLVTAADMARDVFARQLSLLRVAHLVTTTGARTADTVEPYHDRVRAAVLAHLDDVAQAERHGALARALERTGSNDAEALALHWRGAADWQQAAKYTAKAADAASDALAFDRAAKLYERALRLGTYADPERRALYERLGVALANAGRGARAAEAYRDAANGAPAAHALDLQRRAADQLLRGGHLDQGLAAMRTVLASIGIALPRSPLAAVWSFFLRRLWLRIRGLGFKRRDASQLAPEQLTRIDICWSVAFGLGLTDNLLSAAFGARNLLLALRAGEPYRVARAMAIEISYVARSGGNAWPRVEALMKHALTLAEACGQAHAIGWTQLSSGAAFYLNGRYVQALDSLERAAETMRNDCTGVAWELDSVQFLSANCLAQLGALGRLSREAPRALRDALDRGDVYAAVNLRIGLANLRWLAADDPTEACAQISEAMTQWSKQGFHLEHFYELLALTNVDLYAGQPTEAYTRVAERWRAMRRSLLPRAIQSLRIYALHFRARSALAVAEANRGSPLLRVAERDARAMERERMPYSTAQAKLVRAGVETTRGNRDRAAALLREAIAGFDAADMALYAAASRRCLGRLVGGDEGRGLIRDAETWMTSETVKSPEKMTAMLAPGFAKLA